MNKNKNYKPKYVMTQPHTVKRIEKRFYKCLNSSWFKNDPRYKAIMEMLEKYGDRFFNAPASSNAKYHCCFPGGLAYHSIEVFKIATKIYKALEPGFKKESIALCALFHDLGKIGHENQEYYTPETSEWHRDNLGRFYNPNPDFEPMIEHGNRSIMLLNEFIKLNKYEAQAIMYHNGPATYGDKYIAYNECTLLKIIHFSDSYSLIMEKSEQPKSSK